MHLGELVERAPLFRLRLQDAEELPFGVLEQAVPLQLSSELKPGSGLVLRRFGCGLWHVAQVRRIEYAV
jgi:hypothetical protein